MTSIIAPWVAASQIATSASSRLDKASALLRGAQPRPFEPTPEGPQHGDGTGGTGGFIPPYVPNDAALRLSGGALTSINQALEMSQYLSQGIRTAFTGARDAAQVGVNFLSDPTMSPVNRAAAPQHFDAATMWLGLAKNLIAMEYDMPVAPGEPGSPITIKPIFDIQLPHPDAPVQ